jgi:hypothetical protein
LDPSEGSRQQVGRSAATGKGEEGSSKAQKGNTAKARASIVW